MLTSLTTLTRSSGSWPRHRAKARARRATRKAITRAAQLERDREQGKRM